MTLDIKYALNGRGFRATCSECGKLMRRASGCNRGGLVYAEAGAREDYERHRKICPAVGEYPK